MEKIIESLEKEKENFEDLLKVSNEKVNKL